MTISQQDIELTTTVKLVLAYFGKLFAHVYREIGEESITAIITALRDVVD